MDGIRICGDGFLQQCFGSGIIAHRAKHDPVEVKHFRAMWVLCEKLGADRARGIDVVGEDENPEKLQFGFLIIDAA